jgi:uncharacterized membrane protein
LKLPLTLIDFIALGWFFALWVGYVKFAAWRGARVPSLVSAMAEYRKEWWARVLERDQRIVDSSIIANLSNSATFFASTTLFILGGLLALLGTSERVVEQVMELPFASKGNELYLDVKILLLIGIFVFAFFKFTWSLRQHNFCSVLVGAAPPHDDDPEKMRTFVERAGLVASYAADHFNNGLRAYYFGLAALSWFLNAWVFFLITTWVVWVLYYREFHSDALKALRKDK